MNLRNNRQKRFTYWTADGKRHWTLVIGKCLSLAESARFVPARTAGFLRSRSPIDKNRRSWQKPAARARTRQSESDRTGI
jgi:hypothetical protein